MTTAAPEEKPSTLLSVLAALLALGGLPAGMALFAVLVDAEVGQAWMEGGWGMYACLALGALTCLVGAAGSFLAPRGVPAVLGAALGGVVAMVAAASLAWRSVGLASLEAISHASPIDRAIIMRGAMGELDSLTVLAAALAAGLFAALALGAGAGSLATRVAGRRGGLAFFAAALLALAAWQGLSAFSAAGGRRAMWAGAHASTMDRRILLLDGFERQDSGRKAAGFALLAALAVALAGTAALRSHRGAMVGLLAGVLVPIAGVGGMRTLARPNAEMLKVATMPEVSAPLIELDGPGVDLRDVIFYAPGVELAINDDTRFSKDMPIALGIQKGNEAAVLEFMKIAKLPPNSTVTLAGFMKVEPPPFVPKEWAVLFTEVRGVSFQLVDAASDCAACDAGKVTEQGLVVGSETWPLADQSSAPYPARRVVIPMAGLSLSQLVRLGHAATLHDTRLTLVRPGT
ncbi:MAG: hypothetical protein U0228_01565 [Myxococcaceae bacterium]